MRTMDRRRKRIPNMLDYEDVIVIKADLAARRTALEIGANGPMNFIKYIDPKRNAIRYFDPRTR